MLKPAPIVAAMLASACGTDPDPDAPMDGRGALHCHPLAFLADDGGIYVSTADDGAPLACPEHPFTPEDCGDRCVPLWHG
jgi:hypothetical protein